MNHIQSVPKRLPDKTNDIPILDAKTGLNLEMELLQSVVTGKTNADFLLWHCTPSLVVPKSFSRKQNFQLNQQYFKAKGWPIVLRETGGDLTPQCPEIINLAMVFRRPKKGLSIRNCYLEICDPIIKAFVRMGISAEYGPVSGSFCDGDYNITVNGKKIAGTAQRWRSCNTDNDETIAVLVQAAILVEGPFTELWKICNEFYQRSAIDYVINEEKHITLHELQQKPKECISQTIEQQLTEALNDWIKAQTI